MEVESELKAINVDDYGENSIWVRLPRKLNFSPEPSDSDSMPSVDLSPTRVSPPCRPLRTLRLTEKPSTPGTIFVNSNRAKNFDIGNGLCNRFSAPNLNPFTPEAQSRKRSRSYMHNDSLEYADTHALNNNVLKDLHVSKTVLPQDPEEDERPAKRLNIIESNTGLSRYLTEFEEKCVLGTGEFGCVYLCTNRMDGCDYAIKKSHRPIVTGSANERRALNEVFAHAVLGKHENVVRYFTAWSENKHMLIQNEYCNGGSLQDAIEEHRRQGTAIPEAEVRRIVLHLSQGLRYIHSFDLVHMDIKPGNIFMSRESRARPLHYHADDSYEEDDEVVIYKYGDFGHVTSIAQPPKTVEEGDARYLAREVFDDDYSNLKKADIFALGLTVFEAAGGGPLQKNGPEWHDIRDGKVPELKNINKSLNDLVKQMTLPDPQKRPSALEILKHGSMLSPSNKTKEQLERELQAARTKTQILEKKVKVYSSLIKNEMLVRDMTSGVRTRSNARMVGKSTSRSLSTTEFGW